MGMMIGADGVVVRTANPYGTKTSNARPVSTTTTKKKKYKKLNYNYREVSGRILRAKTSVSARQTVTHARTVVAMLRRRYGCGEYNDRELEIAIIHAEKMVRIAKKKMNNLKAEELAKRTSEVEKVSEEQEAEESAAESEQTQSDSGEMSEEELRKMIRRMEQELQELTAENSLDDLTDECMGGGGQMSEEELKLMKKKHRCDEMRQIVEADMKYLKAMFQRMMQEQQEVAAAATLELSGAMVNAPVSVPMAAGGAQAEVQGGSMDTTV